MAITKIGDKFRKYNILREVNGVHIFSIAGYEFGVKDEAITKAMKDGKAVVVEGIVEYVKPGHFIKDRFKVTGLGSSTEVENNKNKGVKEMKQEKENKENINGSDKHPMQSKFDEVLRTVARASESILGAWDECIPKQRKVSTEDTMVNDVNARHTQTDDKDTDIITPISEVECQAITSTIERLRSELNCDTEIKGYEINDDSMFSVNLAIRESSLSEHMGRVGLFSIMTIDVTGKTSDQMFKQCVDEISKKLAYIIDRADNIAHLKNVNGIDSSVYATASGFRVEFTIRENLGYVWPVISIPLQLDNMSLCLRDVIQKMEVWLSPITASKLIVGVFNFFSEYGIDVSFDGLCINRDDIDYSILKTKDSIPMETVQIRFRIPTNGNNYEIDDWSMGVFTVPINLAQVIYINSSARNTVMNAYIQEYVKMIHDTVCRKTGFTKSSVTMTGNHCDDNPRMIKLTINVGGKTNDLRVMINDFDTAVQGVIDLMSVLYDTPTKVIRTSTPNTDNETPDDMVEDYILKESKNISESVYDIISEFEAQCGGSICSIEFLTTDKSIIKITACICQEEETFILHNGKVYAEVDM